LANTNLKRGFVLKSKSVEVESDYMLNLPPTCMQYRQEGIPAAFFNRGTSPRFFQCEPVKEIGLFMHLQENG